MGRLLYRFVLKDKMLKYPVREFWHIKIKEQTGLDIQWGIVSKSKNKEWHYFYHDLLSEKIWFDLDLETNQIEIATNLDELNYLYNALMFMVAIITLEMGGGRMYFLDDKFEHVRITEKNLPKVFSYGWLTIQDIEWAKQPYEIAKNMPGFRS